MIGSKLTVSDQLHLQSENLKTELYQITWDEGRANYLLDYLNEALLAIHGESSIPCPYKARLKIAM